MDLQPKNSSPDTFAIADANSQPDSLPPDTAFTSVPVVHQQGWWIYLLIGFFFNTDKYLDSALFRLPLELRLMIYDHAMDFEPSLDLGWITDDSPDSLRAMAQLSGVSRQIRCETHAWLFDQVCVYGLSRTIGRRIIPTIVSASSSLAWMRGPDEWKSFYTGAPRNFKLGKLYVILHKAEKGMVTAYIEFKKRDVLVEGTKVDMSCSGGSERSLKEAEELSAEALRTSKESFTKSMQAVVDQEGFDGFTFEDLHLLLRNLKISDIEPSGDFSLLFEEVDAAENETPEKFFRNV
jgi:hypothetical protein